MSTWSAKPKVLAKVWPKLEETPNRPKTLGRVAKALCRTKGKDAKGPLISLDHRHRAMQVALQVILSTCNAIPKDLARALPKLEDTPNRPKISRLEAKVL